MTKKLFIRKITKKANKNKSVYIGLFLLLFILLGSIFGPLFSKYSYHEIHLSLKNQSPSLTFWFGTDELGRDVFTRTWWGVRISLFVGIFAAFIDLIIGVIYGSIAAYTTPKISNAMMRFCDVLQAIPYTLCVILLLVVLHPGMITIIIALTLTGWINMARIVRGQMLQIMQNPYINAAKAMGASPIRIFLLHLLPNASNVIIATMMMTIPGAIFLEAFLSFMGLGVQAPIASLGVMINDSITAIQYYPWKLIFPALMITLTMFSFHFIGEGLLDILDPKFKNKPL